MSESVSCDVCGAGGDGGRSYLSGALAERRKIVKWMRGFIERNREIEPGPLGSIIRFGLAMMADFFERGGHESTANP